ncbi:MAG: RDD family protein [Fibrobacteres bacterium]|nr:RDD family protein [Fibrobacterota bacterium]
MSEANPYQASDIASQPASQGSMPGLPKTLASLGSRFGAALIDGLILIAFMVPGMLFIGWGRVGQGDLSTVVLHRLFLLACTAPYYLINGYLVGLTGQTMGKRVFGIQIRRLDGSLPSAAEWFYKRNLPLLLVNQLPVAGGWIVFASYLMIFDSRRRCGHDWIAGTCVVKL